MERETIRFTMFREFNMHFRGETIDLGKELGKQLINLLQVFVINHGKEVSRDFLIETLFTESEDPRNVMKFTIFRLRKDLKKIPCLADVELIQTTKKGYQLTDEFDYTSDVRDFETIWTQLEFVREFEDDHFQKGQEIFNLYKGRLYITSTSSIWVNQLVEYFRSAYANCIILMCKYLMRKQKYDYMLTLNYNAILTEPFYEGLHYYYMKGLIETKDYHKALRYYDDINEAFYKELGTGLSPRFKELYDIVVSEYDDGMNMNIHQIYADLEQIPLVKGGYFCTYDMFKHLYEISIKNSKRDEKRYFIVLLELADKKIKVEKQVIVANRLKDIITNSLRETDIFCRISSLQFVLLVNCHEMDNVHIITQRIATQFYKKNNRNRYRLIYDVKQVA